MTLTEYIQELLLNPSFTSYLVAMQIPTVLCLFFQCYQAYKLGFKEFKLISLAWAINLAYLIINICFDRFLHNARVRFIIITAVDLVYMYFFLTATLHTVATNWPNWTKRFTGKAWIIPIFILAGVFRCIPGSLHIIPYIHVRYVPNAFLDFFVLLILASYFKKVSGKLRRGRILYAATLIYAVDQFLAIAQRDELDKNSIAYLENIGFSLGLLSKLLMLIFLSLYIISAIQTVENEEKNKLLNKIRFAAGILKIKRHYLSAKAVTEEEYDILRSVLRECLNLLNLPLGYYAIYDHIRKELSIVFTSDRYRALNGYTFPDTVGVTGTAVRTLEMQVHNNNLDKTEYFRSDKIDYGEHNKNIDKDVKSVVAIPVVLEEKDILGVYVIESETENYFTDTDVEILKALVSQAATAIANIRLVKGIELGKAALDSLKEIDRNMMKLGKTLDLPNILDFILREALKIAKGELGNIALISNKHELTLVASTRPDNIGKTIDLDDSISGRAYQRKATEYVPDINQEDDDTRRLYKNYLSENDDLICSLVVPLQVQDEVIGILNLESRIPNKFKNEKGNVEGFAGQAAIAIHIFKLLEDVNNTRLHLNALTQVELQMLAANKGLSETLDMILDKGMNLTKKQRAEILLFNNDNELIVKKTTYPPDEGKSVSLNSISGLAAKMGKIVYLPYLDSDDRPLEVIESFIYLPTKEERLLYKKVGWGPARSELCVPLTIGDKVIGIFNLESEKYEDFRSDQRIILHNLALAASIAIHNAQLFEEITVKNQALANSIDKDRLDLSKVLASIINHRIGNSIGAIRVGLIDLLDGEYGPFSEDAKQEFLNMKLSAEIALGSGPEIRGKVTQILATDPTTIDFGEIQASITRHEQFRIFPDVKIEMSGLNGLPTVQAHPILIEEVIFELIGNAIKSMDEAGTVTIHGSHNMHYVTITVADQGCGIDPKDMKKIFNPSYSYWSNGQVGGGVGLYEVRNILRLYRGDLTVESEQGKGSVFTIKLPITHNKPNN